MKKLWLLACISCALNAGAQLRPLKIGDAVPDITFTMVNFTKPQVKLSDFKGRLLILDFWSIWCGSCIHAMPGLQQLQEQLGDKIMVLPVCFSFTREQVQAFFDKRNGTPREINLPSAVCENGGSVLDSLFPTKYFPREIWIDTGGILRAITESAYVTKENIEKMLQGGTALPEQVSQLDFDAAKPLLVANNGGSDSSFIYRSMITGFIDSIAGSARQHNKQFTRLFIANTDITSLVKMSLAHRVNDIYNKQVAWEVKDRSLYIRPVYDTSFTRRMQQTAHCYELILPPSFSLGEAYDIMYEDICRFFHIKTSMQQRLLQCWVLQQTGAVKLPASNREGLYREDNDYTKAVLQNRPVSDLVSFLNKPGLPLLLDETAHKANIDLEIDMGDKDYSIAGINRKLAPYNLTLKQAVRYVPVLVITEVK